MSDTMLLGVLRVPFDLAMSTTTAQIQYHQRGVQAADEIEKLTRQRDEARAEVERLREALRWYASERNYFPWALHYCGPGELDPAAFLLQEPPVMGDGGKRARDALEAKP